MALKELKNTSLNGTEHEPEQEACERCFTISIAIICIKTLVFLMQFAGNSLVVWTIVSAQSLHKSCMMFICNLAISDFLIGVLVLPLGIVFEIYLIQNKFPHWLMDACMVLGYAFCAASMMNLAAMSIDRCLIIIQPIKYKVFMTKGKAKLCIIYIWSVAVLIGFLKGFTLVPREKTGISVTFLSVLFIYLVILVSYGILVRRVKKQNKIRAQMAPSSRNNFHHRVSDQRLAKTVGLVIGVFTICWSLFGYAMLTQPMKLDAKMIYTTWGQYFAWGTVIGLSSTAIHPVIYFYRNQSLRSAAKTLLNNKLNKLIQFLR